MNKARLWTKQKEKRPRTPTASRKKKGKTKEKQKGVKKKAEVHKSCFKHPKAT